MAANTNPHTPKLTTHLSIPYTGFLRLKQLVGNPDASPPIPPLVPIGRTSLWRKVKNGTFPKPVKLGPMTTAWRAEDIRTWIEQQSNNENQGSACND